MGRIIQVNQGESPLYHLISGEVLTVCRHAPCWVPAPLADRCSTGDVETMEAIIALELYAAKETDSHEHHDSSMNLTTSGHSLSAPAPSLWRLWRLWPSGMAVKEEVKEEATCEVAAVPQGASGPSGHFLRFSQIFRRCIVGQ